MIKIIIERPNGVILNGNFHDVEEALNWLKENTLPIEVEDVKEGKKLETVYKTSPNKYSENPKTTKRQDLKELSNKESELLKLIEESKQKVTIQLIEAKLSKAHVGAIGTLLGAGLIEKKKDLSEAQHGKKAVTYYQYNI